MEFAFSPYNETASQPDLIPPSEPQTTEVLNCIAFTLSC